MKHEKVLEILDEIKTLKPGQKLSPSERYDKYYEVICAEEKYNIPAPAMEKYALAIDELYEYLVRVNGTTTQIFAREPTEIPELCVAIHRAFFNVTYTGFFRLATQVKSRQGLLLYISDIELRNFWYSRLFECSYGDCKMKALLSL